MVRECSPPAREPGRSCLARRSTIATSTPANASSPANISPVGPPPAITTACSVIATLRSAPAARTPAPPRRVPATAPPVPPSVRRPRATHTSTTRHAFRDSHFRRFLPHPAIMRHDPGLAASPPVRYILEVERSGYAPFRLSSAVDGQPPHEAAARRV